MTKTQKVRNALATGKPLTAKELRRRSGLTSQNAVRAVVHRLRGAVDLKIRTIDTGDLPRRYRATVAR